jgi:hypothetical protein
MNPEPEIKNAPELSLLDSSEAFPICQNESDSSDSSSPSPPDKPPHRKVAQLPKVLRDQINAMLDDGVPYKLIIDKLQQCTDPSLPYDYDILRVHLEHDHIIQQFGDFIPDGEQSRQSNIETFIHERFLNLFSTKAKYRLGFDVAASGQGNLAVIYIDEAKGADLWLRGLFTCRTEDWHFLKTVLFYFLRKLKSLQAAGDESGLGKQICWEAAKQHHTNFCTVNFSSKKHDLGFALMNQLSIAEKRFPKNHHDIAADFFALRKSHSGNRWVFSEARNNLNRNSHCDIAWAAALASHAHTEAICPVSVSFMREDGVIERYPPYES